MIERHGTVEPLEDGGRRVEGDHAWGAYSLEVDKDGKLVDYTFEVRTPEQVGDCTKKKSLAWMIRSYARAQASGRHATGETIALRQLSCHGNGREKSPCPNRRPSKKWVGRFYCGVCGCGDRFEALLDGAPGHKLEFTKLDCPRKQPGFSNHEEPK